MALSEEENHKFRAVFDQFDANGDGVLSYDELRSALLNVGYEMREQDFQVINDVILDFLCAYW